jgi:hypothetical protein
MAPRPSPRQSAAATEPGVIRRGGDGTRWIVKETAGGVRRWVRLPQLEGRVYRTHDNGGSPYQVVVGRDRVTVYERDEAFDDDVYLSRVLEVVRPLAVHPGTWRGRGGYQSPSPRGNSVLIQVRGATCVFVGHFVFRFSLVDEFVKFVSPLGNSDVPYPWLVGSRFVYLLLEDEGFNAVRKGARAAVVRVPRAEADLADPWGQFYQLGSARQRALPRTPITFLVSRSR